MEEWTPAQAAEYANGRLHLRQIQQACRDYIESRGQRGLPCHRVGTGRHANYFIRAHDFKNYLEYERKPGPKKGQQRSPRKKSAAPEQSQQGGASGEASKAT